MAELKGNNAAPPSFILDSLCFRTRPPGRFLRFFAVENEIGRLLFGARGAFEFWNVSYRREGKKKVPLVFTIYVRMSISTISRERERERETAIIGAVIQACFPLAHVSQPRRKKVADRVTYHGVPVIYDFLEIRVELTGARHANQTASQTSFKEKSGRTKREKKGVRSDH